MAWPPPELAARLAARARPVEPFAPHVNAALPWLAYALLLALLPLVFPGGYALNLLAQMGIAVIACLSYNILLGQGGMLSFGHAVYTGLGAYAAIHLLAAGWGVPVSLLPLAGGAAALAAAAALGWVCARHGGGVFAMMTLGMGEMVAAIALMFPAVFGGEAGVPADRVTGEVWGISFGPPVQMYALAAAYAFACTALMYAFTRTPLGRLLSAVRDSAERAEFIGCNPHRVRWLGFCVAGFFAGVAGALAALLFEIVTPESLGAQRSGAYLLFVFLGGAGAFTGPMLGGVLMVLATVWLSEITPAWTLYMGLAFLLMVMYAPGGLASLLPGMRRGLAGALRRPQARHAALALAWAALLAGLIALVELLYRLQLAPAGQGGWALAGISVNARQPLPWLLAAAVAAAGGAAIAVMRRGK